jgi:hypothetical protein
MQQLPPPRLRGRTDDWGRPLPPSRWEDEDAAWRPAPRGEVPPWQQRVGAGAVVDEWRQPQQRRRAALEETFEDGDDDAEAWDHNDVGAVQFAAPAAQERPRARAAPPPPAMPLQPQQPQQRAARRDAMPPPPQEPPWQQQQQQQPLRSRAGARPEMYADAADDAAWDALAGGPPSPRTAADDAGWGELQ